MANADNYTTGWWWYMSSLMNIDEATSWLSCVPSFSL